MPTSLLSVALHANFHPTNPVKVVASIALLKPAQDEEFTCITFAAGQENIKLFLTLLQLHDVIGQLNDHLPAIQQQHDEAAEAAQEDANAWAEGAWDAHVNA